jgi:spermidine synthase
MVSGLHITADFFDCACDQFILTKSVSCLEMLRKAVNNSGLTIVGEVTHEFSEGDLDQYGFTSVLVLAESHVSIHTWPEVSHVSIDAYVCNLSTDNSGAARHIVSELGALFRPRTEKQNEINRGDIALGKQSPAPSLHLEWTTDTAAFGFTSTSVVAQRRSKFQSIEILDCPQWGKTLRLDDCYMTSELEGFIYHELMIHPIAATHRRIASALIVGGGDGGALKELLRYSDVRTVDLVEIDPEVVSISKEYLGAVHGNAFDDDRVTVHLEDALAHTERVRDRRHDLIVLDLTDERPPAQQLYGQYFFQLLKDKLAPGGAIVLHCGAPYLDRAKAVDVLHRLRNTFKVVRPFGAYIPLYGTYLLFAIASDQIDPLDVTEEQATRWIADHGLSDLRYYNSDVQRGIFCLPNLLKTAFQE